MKILQKKNQEKIFMIFEGAGIKNSESINLIRLSVIKYYLLASILTHSMN